MKGTFKKNREKKTCYWPLLNTSAKMARLFLFVCVFLLSSSLLPAVAQNTPIMRSSEIRAGMRGYGLTVFKGTRVEQFPVVVEGRLKNGLGEADLILIRVLGGYPVTHGTGIIAGMSGSPVYINGRLIGAIGYGWGFSKEPIGGVTPIEFMLKDMDSPPSKRKQGLADKPVTAFMDVPLLINGKTYNKAIVMQDLLTEPQKSEPGTMVLSPVGTMMQVQGFNPRTIELMKEQLKPYGIIPVAVPGGGHKSMKSRNHLIKPGSAVGVTLIDGDLFVGGTGTVTYRKGDSILAFGHPMLMSGSTSLPLNAANIEGIMPSIMRPFKFSSSLGIVGTMTQDRSFAIAGKLGKIPPMYPMTITVHDVERNRTRKFNLKAAQMDFLNPLIVYLAGADAVFSSSSSMKKTTAMVRCKYKLKGYEALEFEDCSTGWDAGSDLPFRIMSYLKLLSHTELGSATVEKAEFEYTLYPKQKIARIIDLSTRYPRVRPGDNLELTATMEDQDGKTFARTCKIPIPPDLKKGVIRVAVAGGDEMGFVRKKFQLLPEEPVNYYQIVEYIRKMEKGNQLTFTAVFPEKTLVYSGIRINSLPLSKQFFLSSSPRGSVSNSLNSYKVSETLPLHVLGMQEIALEISDEVPSLQDGYGKDPSAELKAKSVELKGKTQKMTERQLSLLSDLKKSASPLQDEPASKPSASKAKEKLTGSFSASFDSARDYFQGIFQDTTISGGNISLGHPMEKIFSSDQAFIMAMYADTSSNRIYAAESPGGGILKITPGEKPVKIGRLGDVLINCMIPDGAGNLYIATGTSGRIYRVNAEDKLELLITLKDEIVWDLLMEPSGRILAVTGNRGRLYRIDPAIKKASLLLDFAEAHATSLEKGPDGSVFIGCSNQANVYRMDSSGKISPYYRTNGNSIQDMLYDDKCLWIASDELLYRVAGPDNCRIYFFPEQGVMKILKDPGGTVLACTSEMGRVYRISGEGAPENLFEADINQVMDGTFLSDGRLLIATGNPAGLYYVSGSCSKNGSYLSRVVDTGRFSSFGNVLWTYLADKGTSITLQSRSGNTLSPDETWSDWSPEYIDDEGQKISSPPARYIQLKANLKTDGENSPVLYDMCLYYRNESQSALMEFSSPEGTSRWSGRQDVSWKVFGSSPASMAFDISYLCPEENKWKFIKRNLEPSVKDLEKAATRQGREKPVEMTHKWVTRQVKDGIYFLKVACFDRRDPDNRYLRSEIVSKPLYICNSEPDVTVVSQQKKGRQFIVGGFVKTRLVNVKEVMYKAGQGQWSLAYPEDGIFDNTREKFLIYINPPYGKSIRLTIKAVDEAGNEAVITKTVSPPSVSEEKEEKSTDNDSKKEEKPREEQEPDEDESED